MQRHRFSKSGMKYAISLSPPSPSTSSENYQSSDVEEYQVETCSTSSSKDYQDEDDCETEGAIVVAEKPDLPSFGSVSVVNSKDVHFGNKTVYQGPVTIKQFVYPGSAVSGEGVSGLAEGVQFPPTANGVDNNAFVSDSLKKEDVDKSPSSDNTQQTLPGIRKGLLWLRNLPPHHTRDIVIFISVVMISITVVLAVIYGRLPGHIKVDSPSGDTDEQDENTQIDYSSEANIAINKKLRMVTRTQWLAQPPTGILDPLITPVPLVIIQHTATEPCSIISQCVFHVKTIQKFHIESNKWFDIGYNFLVGGDGSAYEGRGWIQMGAHTFGYNNISIGVGFIGTFTAQKPPVGQIVAFKKLVEKGVELGYIEPDYKIIAARQLFGTESPGLAFFEEIKTWPHWSPEHNANSTEGLATEE